MATHKRVHAGEHVRDENRKSLLTRAERKHCIIVAFGVERVRSPSSRVNVGTEAHADMVTLRLLVKDHGLNEILSHVNP